jgi:hypothetical protein
MAEIIKFTEDELSTLRSIQIEYQQIIYRLGQLEVEKKLLDKKSLELNTLYNEILSKETELVSQLNTKYGTGTLDLESGTFTPLE